jgi:hypothetical protein
MKIDEGSSSDPKWRLFESVHISTHIIYAVLTEKALNPFVKCASGLLSGEGFSITLKFGCKRSIEHTQSLSELPSLAKKNLLRNVIAGIVRCCARAVSGHASAPPQAERATPSRRADQGRDCGAAEIQRTAKMLRAGLM